MSKRFAQGIKENLFEIYHMIYDDHYQKWVDSRDYINSISLHEYKSNIELTTWNIIKNELQICY